MSGLSFGLISMAEKGKMAYATESGPRAQKYNPWAFSPPDQFIHIYKKNNLIFERTQKNKTQTFT